MAHAIHGYQGACKNIHGHSYELHVTLGTSSVQKEYIPSPGFIIDFKQIKNLVNTTVIEKFDHSLVLSEAYLKEHPEVMKSIKDEVMKGELAVIKKTKEY